MVSSECTCFAVFLCACLAQKPLLHTHTHTCARALTRRHLGNATVQDYAFGEVVIGEVPPWETDEIWEVDDEYDNDDDTQTRWLKRSSRSRQARRARRRLKSRSSSSNDDTHYQVVVHVWRLNQYPETTNETVKRFACARARVIFPITLVTINTPPHTHFCSMLADGQAFKYPSWQKKNTDTMFDTK